MGNLILEREARIAALEAQLAEAANTIAFLRNNRSDMQQHLQTLSSRALAAEQERDAWKQRVESLKANRRSIILKWRETLKQRNDLDSQVRVLRKRVEEEEEVTGGLLIDILNHCGLDPNKYVCGGLDEENAAEYLSRHNEEWKQRAEGLEKRLDIQKRRTRSGNEFIKKWKLATIPLRYAVAFASAESWDMGKDTLERLQWAKGISDSIIGPMSDNAIAVQGWAFAEDAALAALLTAEKGDGNVEG